MTLYKDIKNIKQEREQFINLFDPSTLVSDQLINAKNNNNLQSIRIHKFLTHTGKIGKVATARFLATINLDENSKIGDLDEQLIKSIIEYTKI